MPRANRGPPGPPDASHWTLRWSPAALVQHSWKSRADTEKREAMYHLLDSINDHAKGLNRFTLTSWNDAKRRTHSEVMQAFDRAIEDA